MQSGLELLEQGAVFKRRLMLPPCRKSKEETRASIKDEKVKRSTVRIYSPVVGWGKIELEMDEDDSIIHPMALALSH